MIATLLAAGAPDRAPTFHKYVDPVSGNDTTGTGTKALPYATMAKALTVISAGQSIGLKAGTVTREATTLSVPVNNLRIGTYGAGAKAIMSGGKLMTGWAVGGSDVGITTPQSNWSNMSSGDLTGTVFTLTSGKTIPSIKVYVDGNQPGGSVNTDIYGVLYANDGAAGAPATRVAQTAVATITSGQAAGWVTLTFASPPTTSAPDYYVTIYAVAAAGTPYGRINYAPSGYGSYYRQGLSGTTAPNPFGTPGGSGSWGYSVYATIGAGTAGTYQATLAATTAWVVVGSTPIPKGSSATALSANQWFHAGGTLYINLGGTDPGTLAVEASQYLPLQVDTHDGLTLRGLEFRFGQDGLFQSYRCTNHVIDNCVFKWGHEAGNSGSVRFGDANQFTAAAISKIRITRCVLSEMNMDGFWWHNSQNIELDHCRVTGIGLLPGDIASDGIQIEDTYGTNPNSNGFWIHHNYISIDANSPKGCIISNTYPSVGGSSTGLVEWNTCVGGNFGLAIASSGTMWRDNTCLNQVSSFGGGIHVDNSVTREINDVVVVRNLIVGSSRAGIIFQDTSDARRRWTIVNNTIVNSAWAQFYGGAPLGGVIEDNLIWSTTGGPALRVVYILSVASGETLVCDYNLLNTAATNYLRWGASEYSTLAAWRTATGFDAHSISSDPLFANPGAGDYTLQSGSPAINAGVAVAGIGQVVLGAAPDIGYAEKA